MRLLRGNTPLNPPPSLKLRWTRICWSLDVSKPFIRGDFEKLAMTIRWDFGKCFPEIQSLTAARSWRRKYAYQS